MPINTEKTITQRLSGERADRRFLSGLRHFRSGDFFLARNAFDRSFVLFNPNYDTRARYWCAISNYHLGNRLFAEKSIEGIGEKRLLPEVAGEPQPLLLAVAEIIVGYSRLRDIVMSTRPDRMIEVIGHFELDTFVLNGMQKLHLLDGGAQALHEVFTRQMLTSPLLAQKIEAGSPDFMSLVTALGPIAWLTPSSIVLLDCLHQKGYVTTLEEAKKLGEAGMEGTLVEYVSSLDSQSLTLNGERQQARTISESFEYWDSLLAAESNVVITEDTPLELMQNLPPHIETARVRPEVPADLIKEISCQNVRGCEGEDQLNLVEHNSHFSFWQKTTEQGSGPKASIGGTTLSKSLF